jgi:hypothetical protein
VRAVPVFASYTLAFALQLRKKHGKTSIRVAQYKNNEAKYKNNESTIQEQWYSNKNNEQKMSQNNKEHRMHNKENSPLQVSKQYVDLINWD